MLTAPFHHPNATDRSTMYHKPTSTPLPPSSSLIHYTLPPSADLNSTIQPQTTPIAHYTSPHPSKSSGHHPTSTQIDISGSFIVYAVKNGLIRVIDRKKALRTLLRGHVGKVLDIRFFGDAKTLSDSGSDVLGTVGGYGDGSVNNLLIWRVFLKGDNKDEIGSETLLEMRWDPVIRLVWHPFNPNQFWILGKSGDQTMMVETTRLLTVSSGANGEDNSSPHALCLCKDEDLGNALKLGGAEDIVDLCWNEKDVRYVMTASQETVRLWDLRGEGNNKTNSQTAKCVASVKEVQDEKISQCMFLTGYDYENSSDQSSEQTFWTPPFITACNDNTEVSVWSPFGPNAIPQKLKTFCFVTLRSMNLALCTNKNNGTASKSSFLLFSDKDEGNLYALHLASKSTPENKNVFTGFDYLTPFRLVHPVYSWMVNCSPPAEDDDEEDIEFPNGSSMPDFDVLLFCVQSKAVQMLTLKRGMLCSPTQALDMDNLPPHIEVEFDSTSLNKNDEADSDYEEDSVYGSQENDADDFIYEDDDLEIDDDDDNDDSDDLKDHAGQDKNSTDISDLPLPDTSNHAVTMDINDSNKSASSGNAFANWLGAMATKPPASTNPPPSTVSIPTKVTGNIEHRSNDIKKDTTKHMFLSPMELLKPVPVKIPTTILTATPTPPPPPPPPGLENVTIVKQSTSVGSSMDKAASILTARSSTPPPPIPPPQQQHHHIPVTPTVIKPTKKSSTSEKPSKHKSSNNNNNNNVKKSKPSPTPGKIAILRREIPIKPPSEETTAVHHTVKAGITPEEMERILSLHFQKHVIPEIQRTIRTEMQSTVIPSLVRTVTQKMEHTIVKPLTNTILKGNREAQSQKSIRTAEIIDGVKEGVHDPLMQTFSKSMKQVFLPAYESATQQIFSQIDATLQTGLTARQKSLLQKEEENTNTKQILLLTEQVTSLQKTITALTEQVQMLVQTLPAVQSNHELETLAKSKTLIDPVEQIQSQILSLIAQQNYESAFTQALSASNVDIAVFCCKNSDIADVLMTDPVKLTQPILLCLMQQLGSVLISPSPDNNFMDNLKNVVLVWLQDIAVSLDPSDESIRRHVGNVLRELMLNIDAKMREGDVTLRRPLHTLTQIIRGMGGAV